MFNLIVSNRVTKTFHVYSPFLSVPFILTGPIKKEVSNSEG